MPPGFKIILAFIFPVLLYSCGTSRKATQTESQEIIIWDPDAAPVVSTAPSVIPVINTNEALQAKYAGFLNTTPDKITNIKLYKFIDQWMYTPYKWGGMDKRGIDCSAFIQTLLKEVYNINIQRTSVNQFLDQYVDRFASVKHLSEGDLVFFRTMEDKFVSHVGLYLGYNKFINSSSKGVSIGSLADPYWKTKFVAAGRMKVSMIEKGR
jgi:lipoprotein Spr